METAIIEIETTIKLPACDMMIFTTPEDAAKYAAGADIYYFKKNHTYFVPCKTEKGITK